MSKFAILKKQPSLFWLLALGCTILAPMLISVILWVFAAEILSAGLPFTGAFLFAGLFILITILAACFWQALVLHAIHKASSKKSFRFIDAFTDVRTTFVRTTALFFLTLVWILLLSVPLLYVQSLVLEILLGLVLLFTPYVCLRTSVLLYKHSVFASIQKSAVDALSVIRVIEWAKIKSLSLVAVLVVFAGAHPLLLEIETVGQIIRIALSFIGFSWLAVFNPLFGFLLMLGGNGVLHVAVLFVVALLLHFCYMLVLVQD